MAVIFVQMFLALFFTHVCMCTKQDLNSGRLVVGVVRESSNLKEKSKDSAELAAEDLAGDRKKRSLSPKDRTDSVREVNNLRRAVGASDMPYMIYSTVQENNAALWTVDCNMSKPIIVTGRAFALKYATTGISVPSVLVEGFRSYSRQLSSVYLRSFGCDQMKCGSVTFEGRDYSNLTLCLFEGETNFNENLTQYTIGEACTTCMSGSYWCYEGLCRDDCSSQISTCSCFSSCPKCQSWDRGSCTCPSQPKTNAALLDCHNKGEMAFRAKATLAIIVLSTLVLFGLQ